MPPDTGDLLDSLLAKQRSSAESGNWPYTCPDDFEVLAVVGRIRRLSALYHLLFQSVYEQFDISEGEYHILSCLLRLHPSEFVSPTRLRQELTIPGPTVTKRLGALERKGLIERVRTEEDRRALLVRLRPEGKEMVFSLFPRLAVEMITSLDSCREDLEPTNELLRHLLSAVETTVEARTDGTLGNVI